MYAAIVGHVDNGKSSLLSRILYPDSSGDPHLLDTLQEEKERGITQEYSLHELPDSGITFIDTAGHQSFIRSNIEAYTKYRISVAVVVCSLRRGEFEAGFKTRGGTHIPSLKEQLLLLRSCGVSSVIIALTKCDLSSDLLIEEDYVVRNILPFFKNIGVKCESVIRTSSSSGEGISNLLAAIALRKREARNEVEQYSTAREFACRFRILFIPEGRVLSIGSTFAVHSGGEEATAVLERIGGNNVIVVPGVDYVGKFSLDRSIPIRNRIILRLAEATVGFCKNAKAPKKRLSYIY